MAAALCALTSCVRKQVVLDMADQRDSLTHVVSEKDSLINLVFEEINTVMTNLSEIKMRENLITVPQNTEGSALSNRSAATLRRSTACCRRTGRR